jgi:drug/metabolite transporter (DMT)-like permease
LVTANVTFLLATQRGLVSVVAVIASLYPAGTVILAMGVEGERLSAAQGCRPRRGRPGRSC